MCAFNAAAQFRPFVGKLKGTDLKNLHNTVDSEEDEGEENNNKNSAQSSTQRKRKRQQQTSSSLSNDEYVYSEFTRGSGGYMIGDDLQPYDFYKYGARTPFDREVVFNTTLQEHLFDYMFYRLGLSKSTEGVPHPIVMTECICNPNYARSQMNELLFEKYGVPSLCYGIDALFSYYHFKNTSSNKAMNNGLIVRSGYHATHVMPIFSLENSSSNDMDNVCGRGPFYFDCNNVKRLGVGGFNTTEYLYKILQLKYPFTNSHLVTANQTADLNVNTHLNGGITLQRAQEIKEKHCYVSTNYGDELYRLGSDEKYFNEQTRVIFDNYDEWKLQNDYYESHKSELEQSGLPTDESTTATPGEETKKFESKQEAEKWLRQVHLKLVVAVQELKTVSDALVVRDEQPAVDIKSKRSAATKQRKKAQLAAQIHEGDDETFGMDEDHWDLYTEMELPGKPKLDSKQRKQFQRRRKELESEVAQLTREIQLVEQDVFGHQRSTVPTFFLNQYQHGNVAKKNRRDNIFFNAIYATVERMRAPEIVFQPGMIGLDNPGIIEIIQTMISQYPTEKQKLLLSNVYLCGGNTHYPQFAERIQSEIRAITPYDWPTVQVHSEQSTMDVWRGAREWYGSNNCNRKEAFLTREMYDEFGSNRLQQHFLSNIFVTKPPTIDVEEQDE